MVGVIIVVFSIFYIFAGPPDLKFYWRLYIIMVIIGLICAADLKAGMHIVGLYAQGINTLVHAATAAIKG